MKLLAVALFIFPLALVAQNKLSGTIFNGSGESHYYCKLLLIRDSAVLKTISTDSVGNYAFEMLPSGMYKLSIRVPFQTIDTLIEVDGPTLFSLKIVDGKNIEDVVIIGKKPTVIQKVDRTIFNPENIPDLVGGNAVDVIEYAPGVFINGDNIQLSNGRSANVLLNDKMIPLTGSQLISFIKSIPTEDIQYVEIIPVPPAKYASSTTGLINIKLVVGAKSKLSKGSIATDIGQKFYSQQDFTASYAYRKNKYSLYTNANVYNSKYHYYGNKSIEFDTLGNWNEDYITNNNYRGINGGLGMNYELGSRTEIGILCFANFYDYGTTNMSQIENKDNENVLVNNINNSTIDQTKNQKHSANLNLVSRLDSLGRKIDVNFDYTYFSNNSTIDFLTQTKTNFDDSLFAETNRLVRKANLFSGGIDYIHPISKSVTLNLGGRYSYTTNKYKLAVFNDKENPGQEDMLKSNEFNYVEHIQAIYTSVDWNKNRWSFQIGLRCENTMIIGESPTTGFLLNSNYFQLVPKMFVMYKTKKGKFWNLSYSRDFYRPSYDELNPFRYYTSSYSYRVGNPYLKPSVYHSISLLTTVGDFRFSLAADYSAKGTTAITIYDDSTKVQRTAVANLYSSTGISLYTNYFKSIFKRLSLDINLITSLSNTRVREVINSQSLTAFMVLISVNISYALDKNKTFFLKGNISYNTPTYQQITRNVVFPYMSFSLTKNMLKNRLNMKVSFNDPFRIMRLKSTTISNQTIVRDNNYFDTQSIFISLTFKFGNYRMGINERQTNSTGEGGRVGK